jgi:hypothetical protein
MTEETTTNLVEGDDARVEVLEGVEDAEIIEGEDGQPEETEPELVEIERGDKKYKVPKDLQSEFLMQADYTRKTQELAEQRRQIEAYAANVQTLDREQFEAQATLHNIDRQLAEYADIDWQAWRLQNPDAAQAARYAYEDLKEQRAATEREFQTKAQQRAFEAQRVHAQQLEQAQQVLAKEIPGWSPQRGQELMEFGTSIGIDRNVLATLSDPLHVKILHLAELGHKASKTQAQATKVAQAQKTQPATTLRGGSGRFTAAADTSDFSAFEKMADAKLAARK